MNTRIVAATEQGIAEALALLRQGEVIGLPTETVYGLAGNALDPQALARIFEAKERPRFDPLIVHIAPPDAGDAPVEALHQAGLVEFEALSSLARTRVAALANAFWPGPFTLVLPKRRRVPDLATSGLATVAVRMPSHSVAQTVLAQVGLPLAAPSANRFGRISPTCAEDVYAELQGRIPLVLDGGPCEVGLESSVLAVEPEGSMRLLRPGGVEAEQIAALTKAHVQPPLAPDLPVAAPEAPGMLARHYAPGKRLHLLPAPLASLDLEQLPAPLASLLAQADSEVALLTFAPSSSPETSEAQRILRQVVPSTTRIRCYPLGADMVQAAQRLFAALREMDASPAEVLLAEPAAHPHTGLAAAIQNRLERAAATTPEETEEGRAET